MDRRGFLGALSSSLLATPLVTVAQTAGTVYHIGWLDLGRPLSSVDSPLDAFRRGLHELGWIDGGNVVLETRYADDDLERLATAAAELVRSRVDVIVTITTQAALAAKKATSSIPIVMAGSSRPVELGLIESLARPGNNVTGVTNNPGRGFNQKVVQLLIEAAPQVSRVALLWGGTTAPGEANAFAELQASAPALGITVLSAEAPEPSDLPAALAAISPQANGLYVLPSSTNTSQRELILDFALANRVPSIFADARWVTRGGLMSYGIDWLELRRHSAKYVDRILRGIRPSDLPVEQPSRFQLAINLKTAKAIGLNIPQTLLQRADDLIQ
jgi:ABC-type uncharacterized transport system substrate-binding protein